MGKNLFFIEIFYFTSFFLYKKAAKRKNENLCIYAQGCTLHYVYSPFNGNLPSPIQEWLRRYRDKKIGNSCERTEMNNFQNQVN